MKIQTTECFTRQNAKRIRMRSVWYVLAFKKRNITDFFLTSVICDPSPIQPRYFGFLTLGKQWVGNFGEAKT